MGGTCVTYVGCAAMIWRERGGGAHRKVCRDTCRDMGKLQCCGIHFTERARMSMRDTHCLSPATMDERVAPHRDSLRAMLRFRNSTWIRRIGVSKAMGVSFNQWLSVVFVAKVTTRAGCWMQSADGCGFWQTHQLYDTPCTTQRTHCIALGCTPTFHLQWKFFKCILASAKMFH